MGNMIIGQERVLVAAIVNTRRELFRFLKHKRCSRWSAVKQYLINLMSANRASSC